MNNLANTYRNQERWKEAKELGIQVLETQKQALGLEHPDTLSSMLSNISRSRTIEGSRKATGAGDGDPKAGAGRRTS